MFSPNKEHSTTTTVRWYRVTKQCLLSYQYTRTTRSSQELVWGEEDGILVDVLLIIAEKSQPWTVRLIDGARCGRKKLWVNSFRKTESWQHGKV